MRTRTWLGWMLGLTFGALGTGCHDAPKKYEASLYQTPEQLRQAASEHWKAKGEISLGAPGRTKVAVTEFNVEFVTEQIRSLVGKQQAVAGAQEFTLVGGSLTILGFGRHKIKLEDSLKEDLPDVLYEDFVEQLRKAGYAVVPMAQVKAAKSFDLLEGAKPGEGNVLMLLNLVGSDTGRIKQSEVYAVKGLKAVKGVKEGTVDEVNQKILEETGADVGLRVHYRVGLFDAYASLESGSMMEISRVSLAGPAGTLTAQKSLIGAEPVVDSKSFKMLQGDVYKANSGKYKAAIRTLGPIFSEMAVERTKLPAEEPMKVDPSRRSAPGR